MKSRNLLIGACILSFGFAAPAWAGGVTVTLNANGTVSIDPANGVGTVGTKVTIVNNSGAAVTVTITQSDGTIIMDAVNIADGGQDDSKTVSKDGVVSVCIGGRGQCEELDFIGSIPTVSEWSLIIMTVLAFTAGTILFSRRRRAAAA